MVACVVRGAISGWTVGITGQRTVCEAGSCLSVDCSRLGAPVRSFLGRSSVMFGGIDGGEF